MKLSLLLVLLSLPVLAQDVDAGEVVDAGSPAAVVVAAPVPAVAPPAVQAPDSDPVAFVKAIHDVVMNKDWGKLVFFTITALVWAIRKFLGDKWAFLKTKLGGIILAFAVAFGGMLATTWPAGTKLTVQDVLTAIWGGFMAAGGWSTLKNLIEHFKAKGANPAPPAPDPKPTA